MVNREESRLSVWDACRGSRTGKQARGRRTLCPVEERSKALWLCYEHDRQILRIEEEEEPAESTLDWKLSG